MSATAPRRTAEATTAVVAMATAVAATAVFLVWRDGSTWWPSALPGHALGGLGFALMLWAGFGYSWRKRSVAPGAPPMARAMHAHMVAGLLGPYLVILHSGLAFRGLAGVLSLLLVLVVASGVLGRAVFVRLPKAVTLVDPIRVAMLDAEIAGVEGEAAVLARSGREDPVQRAAIDHRFVALRHEQELLHSQRRHDAGTATSRRALSVWWWLHAPASMALWVLAAAHVLGTLYFGVLSR